MSYYCNRCDTRYIFDTLGRHECHKIENQKIARRDNGKNDSLISLLRYVRIVQCGALIRSLTRSRAHGKLVFAYEMTTSNSYSVSPPRNASDR